MEIPEMAVFSSLITFFRENNFPYILGENGNLESFVIQRRDADALDNIQNDDESVLFSFVHYIQALFTSIMLLYIDESSQSRSKIFDNIQNLINDLESEQPWTKEKQEIEGVSFLIEKIIYDAHLIQPTRYESIKNLTAEIFEVLKSSDHVTQMEFIKFPKHESTIANGFMTKDGNFYIPLSIILTAFQEELKINHQNPVFEFLFTIEKHTLQIKTKNLEILNFNNKINSKNWEMASLDFDNMDIKSRQNYINQYDQEIQDLLYGISAQKINEIDELDNQSFQYVLPNFLSELTAEEQFKLFFNVDKNRFNFISKSQFEIIKPETFSLLNEAVNQKIINSQILNEFIGKNGMFISIKQLLSISLNLLEAENQKIFLIKMINSSREEIRQFKFSNSQSQIITVLIERRHEDLDPSQIKFFEFWKFDKNIVRIIVIKMGDQIEKKNIKYINLSYFNDDEKLTLLEKFLPWMEEEQLLTIYFQKIKDTNQDLFNNTKKYMIDHSKDHDSMIYKLYLFHSKRFEINDTVIKKMPEGFKMVYLNNHADTIPAEYQHLFQQAIRNIFENPCFYRKEIFSILIKQWNKDIIGPLIKYIDINEYPIMYLKDIIDCYSTFITPQQIERFQINSINQIENTTTRFSIFSYFLNHFIEKNKYDIIKTIKIQLLNEQELELLLEKACKHLITDQVIKIDILLLKRSSLLVLLKEKINSMLPEQISKLDFQDPEIARIFIQSGKSYLLQSFQVPLFNLKEQNSDIIKTFINEKIEKKFIFEFMDDDQIQFIEFNMIRIDAQKDFLKSKGLLLNERQVRQILFKKNVKLNIQILEHLKNANKLQFLSKEQAKLLFGIFEYKKYSEIEWIFISKEFTQFYTNNQATYLNDEVIQTLNLNNLEPHFHKFILKSKIDIICSEQFQQIDFQNMNKTLINAWFEVLSVKLTEKNWNQFSEKIACLSNEKLHEIEISNLDNKMAYIILLKRIDDLAINKIQQFDASDPNIAKELINKKFDLIEDCQKYKIPLSKLNVEDQATYILKLEKQSFFAISSINKNEIKNTNLLELKQYKEAYFTLLTSDKLSKNQYMIIDWMEKDEYDRNIIAIKEFLMKKLKLKEEDYQYLSHILISDSSQQIDHQIFERSPIPFKVAFLNTKILNSQLINEGLITYFIPDAIKIIFKSSKNYLKTVQFIINEWMFLFDSICKVIDKLAIQKEFSSETITNLLSDQYLLFLSKNQIHQLILTNIDAEIVENALTNRADCFLKDQILNSNCSDKEIVSNQLENVNSNQKIHSLNIIDLNIVLVNYLFNRKFDLLNNHEINEFIAKRVKELKSDYVKKIKLTQLSFDNLNTFLQEKMDFITDDQFSQLNSETLKQLHDDILLNLLRKFIKIIKRDQIENISLSNPHIAAFLIINLEHYLTKEHYRSMNFDEVSIITHKENNINVIDIIRKKNRYRDISTTQLNQLDFTDCINIKHILDCDREKEVTKENCMKINMKNIEMLNENQKIKLIRAFTEFFNEEQINDLDITKTDVLNIVIQKNRTSSLKKENFQLIDVKQLSDKYLSKLIIDVFFYFSKEQTTEQNVIKALNNQTNEDVLMTLGNIDKIQLFQSYHIDALKITSMEVASLMIINHCNALSIKKMQSFDTGDWNHIDKEIKKRTNKHALYYVINAKRLHDLKSQQFNDLIGYSNPLCVKEILNEKLENKINKKNAVKINLMDEYRNLSSSEFIRLFQSCYTMFNREQIDQFNISFLEDHIDILKSLIIERLSYLNEIQMKNNTVINIIKNLNHDEILKMINDEHNKKYVKRYHICNIIISTNFDVAKTLIKLYPQILTKEQIQSVKIKEKKITNILISNNRLIDFTNAQLNSYIDYSNSNDVIELLKYDSLIDAISIDNINKINLKEIYEKITNKQHFLSFLEKLIKNIRKTNLAFLDVSNNQIAKIIRENNRICDLDIVKKSCFNHSELDLCSFNDLFQFFIFGINGSFDVAIGILLYRFFKNKLDSREMEIIESQMISCIKNKKFNEIYFAKCILLANQKLGHFQFHDIAQNFFDFFDICGQKVNFDILDYMTYKSFTNECKMFNISPLLLQYIIKEKYTCCSKKDSFKKSLSKITSSFIFYSWMGSEYQEELKKFLITI